MSIKLSSPLMLAGKSAIALAISLCASAVHADTVSGTINKATHPSLGAGVSVDYWSFTLASDANVVIDVLSNEGVTNAWGSPPGAYEDLNHDGEITLSDTHFLLFNGSVTSTSQIAAADDSGAYTFAHDINGWGDGTLSLRDSYFKSATALSAGTYYIAFSDYQLTTAEAVQRFNAGDTITAATGINPFTGATGQDHFDYTFTIVATDAVTGAALNVNTQFAPVPVPGAVWLFGSALAGLTAFGRRKSA